MSIILSTLRISSSATINFIKSSASKQSGGLEVSLSTVHVQNNSKIMFKNCMAYAAAAGAMSLKTSALNVTHNATITFINNFAAYQTGALDAQNHSQVNIENYATVTFINNTAVNIGLEL